MEPTFRVVIIRFGLNFSIASLPSLPLAAASIWFRGTIDIPCIHLILFSVSSVTAVLSFGLQPPGTIVAFLTRLVVFQCILGVEIANSYLFPYVLGESEPILVGPQDAIRLVLLVFAALVQSIALAVLLQWSTRFFASTPDELAPCPDSNSGSFSYPPVRQTVEDFSKDGKAPSTENAKEVAITFPSGYSPTFDPNEGFKFTYGPREHQWFDDKISPLEVSPASPLGSGSGSDSNGSTFAVPTPVSPSSSLAQKCTCAYCSDLPCSPMTKSGT